MNTLKTEVRFIKGIGEKRAKLLNKISIFTLSDFLSFFPRDYEDRTKFLKISELRDSETACVRAVIATDVKASRTRGGRQVVKCRAFDDTGSFEITFFNQPYIKGRLIKGKEYIFYGRVQKDFLATSMVQPSFEEYGSIMKNMGRILPVYPLTAGLSRNDIMRGTSAALEAAGTFVADVLPEELRKRYKLADAYYAYENIHFPKTMEDALAARRRFVFEELFFISLGLKQLKSRRIKEEGIFFQDTDTDAFINALGYKLTGAQKKAVCEAARDLVSGRPMNRLLQGDVGSGKTAVAAVLIYLSAVNGFQTAFMAPTSILAEQHFKTLSPIFERFSIKTCLLTGAVSAKEKANICGRARSGEIKLLIGTHALIEKEVGFNKLALVITDEQHRFGVSQRAELLSKGDRNTPPHMLVMSATPIPRTLALILYGDLDISVLDELPPGRKPVKTGLRSDEARARAFRFVKNQLEAGRQAYIVCPLVDDNGNEELKAVEAYAAKLQDEVFPGVEIGIMHGRLKPSKKEEIMRRFAANEIKLLVSTTVIEVGINVPNATVMIIENAERFGLSQLHQLRGRVGRGAEQSYCVLFSQSDNEETLKRLSVFCSTNDGFKIAEEDLRLRGPGDFFGSRQHGLPVLKTADLVSDVRTLREAQEAADYLLSEDPEFTGPEHAKIAESVCKLFEISGQTFN
ncbi:MAG: ATP-dependent DNA helicase RecG [Bacillota bacterium]|nr:ATP-dependent DNA helicase RecG [Bacillota bacterium]